jgi:hypothetical protein
VADREVLDYGICMDGKPIYDQPADKFKSGMKKIKNRHR